MQQMITNFQSMQFFHANQNSPIQTHQTILDTKLLGVLYDRGGEFRNIAFAGFICQELKLGFWCYSDACNKNTFLQIDSISSIS